MQAMNYQRLQRSSHARFVRDRAPYSWNMVNLFSFGCHVTDRAYVRTYQGVRSQGVETSGVERSSSVQLDVRVWILPKRQNKMAHIILNRQRDYPAKVSHYPVAFICCKQERRNKLLFLTFVFCFVQFSPRKPISVLNIAPPP